MNASLRETLAFLTKTVYHIQDKNAIVPIYKYFREIGENFVQLVQFFGGFYALSFDKVFDPSGGQRAGGFGGSCARWRSVRSRKDTLFKYK